MKNILSVLHLGYTRNRTSCRKDFPMLKGVPEIIPPALLKILDEMGHGDELVISDAHFPAYSVHPKVVHVGIVPSPAMLEAVLKLLELDQYVEKPVKLMERVPGDNADVSIWKTYEKMIEAEEPRGISVIEKLERFAFYDEAKKAYAIIATTETSQYANVILQKGCVL